MEAAWPDSFERLGPATGSPARAPQPLGTSRGDRKRRREHVVETAQGQNEELGDAIPSLNGVRRVERAIEDDNNLAAVFRVDDPRGVQHRNALLESKPTPRANQVVSRGPGELRLRA